MAKCGHLGTSHLAALTLKIFIVEHEITEWRAASQLNGRYKRPHLSINGRYVTTIYEYVNRKWSLPTNVW